MQTKAQEKRIQEIIRRVHERRQADSLAQVEQAILDWREGSLPILKVDDVIRLHIQRATRYFSRYANTPASALDATPILDEAIDLGLIGDAEYNELAFRPLPAAARQSRPKEKAPEKSFRPATPVQIVQSASAEVATARPNEERLSVPAPAPEPEPEVVSAPEVLREPKVVGTVATAAALALEPTPEPTPEPVELPPGKRPIRSAPTPTRPAKTDRKPDLRRESREVRDARGTRPPRAGGPRNFRNERSPRPGGPGGFRDRPPRPGGPSGFRDRPPRPGGPGGFRDRPPRPGGPGGFRDRPPRPGGPGGF